MKLMILLSSFIAGTVCHTPLFAQSFEWERNAPGHLYPAKRSPIPGFKINAIYDVMNRIPALAHPKGFDVQEWYSTSTESKPYAANLNINFFRFYKQQDGTVERQDENAPDLIIAINDRKRLLDNQSVMFSEETNALNIPKIFTDTFPLSYKTINGCRVGEGINTEFGRPVRFLMVNPSNRAVFRPVTVEQYIRVFLVKLKAEIAEESKGLEESAKTFKELAKNPALKGSMAQLESSRNTMVKLVDLKKSRKQYFEKKLSLMTADEKKAPASYAIYKESPTLKEENTKLGSHLLYEPYLDNSADTLATKKLYTFSPGFFDPKAPKTAFQLMVISEPFRVDQVNEFKDYFSKELYPLLPLKELSDLMHR
jgi:hypothetical protein